jgi:hypothetical protein
MACSAASIYVVSSAIRVIWAHIRPSVSNPAGNLQRAPQAHRKMYPDRFTLRTSMTDSSLDSTTSANVFEWRTGGSIEACKSGSAALDLVDVWRMRVSAILTACFLTLCVSIILFLRAVGVVLLVVAVVESPNICHLNCGRCSVGTTLSRGRGYVTGIFWVSY